jgi:hypothetical protein
MISYNLIKKTLHSMGINVVSKNQQFRYLTPQGVVSILSVVLNEVSRIDSVIGDDVSSGSVVKQVQC